MHTYLVVYYGSVVPTFSYAETLEEARSYALILLSSQHCTRNDVLSIVDVIDDRVIYYGKRDKLIAKFNAIDLPTANAKSAWPSLKPVLSWISLKLAGLTAG